MKKVGVIGWYNCGNFGDDLMAVMVASHLAKADCDVLVYADEKIIDGVNSVKSCSSVKELVEKSEVIVWGGGGYLIPGAACESLALELLQELETCDRECKKRICFISIGSDGGDTPFPNESARYQLLHDKRCLGGTVRLEQDLSLIDSESFEYHPDIVLLASDVFPPPIDCVQEKGRRRIGLNLPPWAVNTKIRLLFRLLFKLPLRTEFVVVKTVDSDCHQPYEYDWPALNQLAYKRELVSYLHGLSRLDSVVTFKLHLGVASMSYGCSYYNYSFSGKTRSFLNGMGLNRRCYRAGLKGFCRLIVGEGGLFGRVTREDSECRTNLEKFRNESRGHFLWLEKNVISCREDSV